MRTPTQATHDEATCHACGQIALRRTSGAHLDPDATIRPEARMGETTLRRVSDASHERLAIRLEVLDLVANLDRMRAERAPMRLPAIL